MKKFTTILIASLLATSLSFAQQADTTIQDDSSIQSQSPKKSSLGDFGIGIRAAFNYNSIYGLNDDWNVYADESDPPSGIGFEAGLAGRMQIFPFLQFTPEFLISYSKLEQDDGDKGDREFSYYSFEIPVLFRVTPIPLLYLTAGPQLEFTLSDKASYNSGKMTPGDGSAGSFYHKFPEEFNRKSFLCGLTFGAGVSIIERINIDARMHLGFTEAYKGDSKLISLKKGKIMGFRAGLGFWFI